MLKKTGVQQISTNDNNLKKLRLAEQVINFSNKYTKRKYKEANKNELLSKKDEPS